MKTFMQFLETMSAYKNTIQPFFLDHFFYSRDNNSNQSNVTKFVNEIAASLKEEKITPKMINDAVQAIMGRRRDDLYDVVLRIYTAFKQDTEQVKGVFGLRYTPGISTKEIEEPAYKIMDRWVKPYGPSYGQTGMIQFAVQVEPGEPLSAS